MKNRTTHYFKPMLCGTLACVRASVLAFLKQGSSLQQCLIAGVVETAEVYAKMAHNEAASMGSCPYFRAITYTCLLPTGSEETLTDKDN